MLNRTGLIFCTASLSLAGAACVAGFSLVALPRDTLEAAKTAQQAEALPDLDLPGLGRVSVTDLMGYYLDNPPAPTSAGAAAAPVRRFGGC